MAESVSSNTGGTSDDFEMPNDVRIRVESGYNAESVAPSDDDTVIFWRDLVDEDIVLYSDDDVPLDVLVRDHGIMEFEEEDSSDDFHIENLNQVHLLPELHSQDFYNFWVERGFFNAVVNDFAELNMEAAYDADIEMFSDTESSDSESDVDLDSDQFSV